MDVSRLSARLKAEECISTEYRMCDGSWHRMLFIIKKEFEQFEEWFEKSGYENVEHKRKKLIKNSIIQHILEKENRDGRPEVGILEIAACYWIYKDWRMQKYE